MKNYSQTTLTFQGFVSVLLLASTFNSDTHAAIVTSEDDAVFGVDSITRDSSSGLDWLDWTLSEGRSFDDVSSHFGPGGDFEGWRYAFDAELLQLYMNAGINSANINQMSEANAPEVDSLRLMLGNTNFAAGFPADNASAMTAEPLLFGLKTIATLTQNEGFNPSGGAYTSTFYTNYSGNATSSGSTLAGVGSALVRSTPSATSPVPEPSSLLLLGMCAAGSVIVLRRGREASRVVERAAESL